MEEKIRLAVFGQKRLSREGGIEIVVKELCTRMAQNGCDITCYNRADACKAVSQTDIPILIIHGDRDTQAPLSMAYRLYDSCSSEKQLYVVHGANHAENYRKDPEGYENVIAQFVEEHSGALKKEY